jgi:hypothetical protein
MEARARTGDADRRGDDDLGVGSDERGDAPVPSERFGVRPSGRATGVLARSRRRLTRVDAPTSADFGTPWQARLIRQSSVLWVGNATAMTTGVALAVAAVATDTPWWTLFGLVPGLWDLSRFPAKPLVAAIVASAITGAIFVLSGSPVVAIPLVLGHLIRHVSMNVQLNWRRRDVGDPTYDRWRHGYETLSSWRSVFTRTRA